MNRTAVGIGFGLILLCVFFSGCGGVYTESQLGVVSKIYRYDHYDGQMDLAFYTTVTEPAGGKEAGVSEVTVTGPMGSTKLAETSPGFFEFTFTGPETALHYVPGETYTFNINRPNSLHTGTVTAVGGMSYDADGNTVTWAYGDDGYISVRDPGNETRRYFPEIGTRTVFLTASGAYAYGSGTYLLEMGADTAIWEDFPYTNPRGSGLSTKYQKEIYITK